MYIAVRYTPVPMRIIYVTHTRFPTEKAHGNQVAQVCHALAQLGHDVTLLAPTVRSAITADAFVYYGLPPSFRVVYPGSFDALGSPFVPGPLAFMVGMWSYRRSLRRYFRGHAADLLYVRSPSLLQPLLKTGLPVMLELHTLPRHGKQLFARYCNRCFKVICLTTPMRDALLEMGVDASRVTVESDGVDLTRFVALPDVATAKARLGLPADRPVIGYVGSLLARNTLEKGVKELVSALRLLKSRDVACIGLIVGGPPLAREWYEQQARKEGLTERDVVFHDHVPAADVPSMIAACDVCVYPAPRAVGQFFLRDTSPLKLFEYLAACKPVVCSNLPPVRDVVDETCVTFCRPGDPSDIANGVAWVLRHPEQAAAATRAGKEIVSRHSWTERMRRIIGEEG